MMMIYFMGLSTGAVGGLRSSGGRGAEQSVGSAYEEV
jgi:hypothetical protein